MNAIVRYYGAKSRVVQWLLQHVPPHRAYTEVFGGAGTLLMHKTPARIEVYNDLDGELCNVFRVLRDPAQARELERFLRLTPYARSEYDLSGTPSADPIEQARRTIVGSWLTHGGTFGRRGRGGFRLQQTMSDRTLPQHEWTRYPDRIETFCRRLQGVIVENHPAAWVLQKFDSPHTLHYVDPPYLLSTRGTSRRYRFDMSEADHRALALTLHALKGMVMLSGYDSPLYRELYADWHLVTTTAYTENRDRRTECLWLSPNTLTRLPQQQPFAMEGL
jgi:DNA adenine methylase